MSIIQEALKKAQGDFAEKMAPQKKRYIAEAEPVKDEPARPVMEPLPHREEKKSPSMRLPALVSVITILLLVYGLRSSLQYTGKHDAVQKASKNAAEPAVNKNPENDIANILGQASKMGPMSFMGPGQSMFTLSGIMYIENRPQAIINGQVLEEGDKIGGATVLAIEENCVLMSLNDTSMKLEMSKKS